MKKRRVGITRQERQLRTLRALAVMRQREIAQQQREILRLNVVLDGEERELLRLNRIVQSLEHKLQQPSPEIAGLREALAVVQRQLQKPVDDAAVKAPPFWRFNAEHLFNLHAQDLQAFERDCLARAQ